MLKAINAFGAQAWYYEQIRRLGDGLEPDLKLGVWRAFRGNQAKEAALAKAMAAAA
jgi:hypothetical protein